MVNVRATIPNMAKLFNGGGTAEESGHSLFKWVKFLEMFLDGRTFLG